MKIKLILSLSLTLLLLGCLSEPDEHYDLLASNLFDAENTDALDAKEDTETTCSDGIDNDGDRDIDCDDDDCAQLAFCIFQENNMANCHDEEDNDEDGLIDCEDPNCNVFCLDKLEDTADRCNDGIDNDDDDKTDCDDPDCSFFCEIPAENTQALCGDEVDNDDDGDVDCEDADCSFFCAKPAENSIDYCTDKIDNDEDGDIDCDDPDCDFYCKTLLENSFITCSDGIDNDDNGLTDCEDTVNCEQFCEEVENNYLLCSDNLDNDNDGKIDCDDTDCDDFIHCQAMEESTHQTCNDGVDNDGDGDIDCDDDGCKYIKPCYEFEPTVTVVLDTVKFGNNEILEPLQLTEIDDDMNWYGVNSFGGDAVISSNGGEVSFTVSNDWGGIYVQKGDYDGDAQGDPISVKDLLLTKLNFELRLSTNDSINMYIKPQWCREAELDECNDTSRDGTGASTNIDLTYILNKTEPGGNPYDGQWHSYSIDVLEMYPNPNVADVVTIPFSIWKNLGPGSVDISARNVHFGGKSDAICVTRKITDENGDVIDDDGKIYCSFVE